MEDYDEYLHEWQDLNGLSQDEINDLEQEFLFQSVDLKEATYKIPGEIFAANVEFFDTILDGYRPWEVFHDLFSEYVREIDMSELIKKNYWDGDEIILSKRGSFMGDGLSFMHLTALLVGLVRATSTKLKVPRPIGQSIGDDLFLMKVKLKFGLTFLQIAEGIGCEFSKINSISKDSATFCEQYVATVSDLDTYRELKTFENSIFGDLVYLDVIKGSILSGHSKVKADGSSPFLGHATMLNKQVRYAPQAYVKQRSKTFLWARNYVQAIRLSSNMATLPIALGGVDLAIGRIVSYWDADFRDQYLPWYEGMLLLEERMFLRFYLLLRGIYKSNPKGIKWLNELETIKKVTDGCELISIHNLDDVLPEYLLKKSVRDKLSYIEKDLNLISFHELISQLARQDAFLRLWNQENPETFMTLLNRDARHRANKAWAIIKTDVAPVAAENFKSHSMDHLVTLFQQRTWGLYVKKDDKAIIDCFCGMPTLMID